MKLGRVGCLIHHVTNTVTIQNSTTSAHRTRTHTWMLTIRRYALSLQLALPSNSTKSVNDILSDHNWTFNKGQWEYRA
jgi:hypothetical protein